MDYKKAVENIRKELKSYITDNKIKSLVMGISGGMDSTLCALLAKPICDELGILLIGRSLPASSNSIGENSRAKEIGKLFCTDFKEVNIEETFEETYNLACYNFEEDSNNNDILKGNIKARIRMILLYDIGATRGMVLSTDNYTEYLLGFWTLHGDVGDYGMIQNLWKTEVYEMAEWIAENELRKFQRYPDGETAEIPSEAKEAVLKVIVADATDGLGISKTDLDQILPEWKGGSRRGYEIVDSRLQLYLDRGVADLDDPVVARMFRTEFKRLNPVNIQRDRIT